jgi:hypothetical protein
MIRQSLLTFALRRQFRARIVSWLLLALAVFLYFLLAAIGNSPLFDMSFGVLITSLLLFAVFLIAGWRSAYISRIEKMRRMDPPEAELIFTDENMTIAGSLSTTTLSWKCFTEVWELPQCWIWFLAENEYFTLPVDTWPPEVKEFVRSKLQRIAIQATTRRDGFL